MPTTDAICSGVMGSTIARLARGLPWYWGLSKTHLEATTAEMQATVAKLTPGPRSIWTGSRRSSTTFRRTCATWASPRKKTGPDRAA